MAPVMNVGKGTRGARKTKLAQDWHGSVHLYALGGNPAGKRDRLHARGARPMEGLAVSRVDVARERDPLRRADLHQEKHDRAAALSRSIGEFRQVLCAADGHRIRELGAARYTHHVYVFDLNVAGRTTVVLEQEINPTCLAVAHLAAEPAIIAKLGHLPGGDRLA